MIGTNDLADHLGNSGGFAPPSHVPPILPNAPLSDFESVEDRLIDAFRTLNQLPDPERRFLRVQTMAIWREARPEEGDVLETSPARPGVFRDEYHRMEEALSWCEWLSGEDRRLMGKVITMRLRGDGLVEWPVIRRQMETQRTTDALRKAYSRSLTRICAKLNNGDCSPFHLSRR